MSTVLPEINIEEYVDQLLAVLDRDIVFLQQNIERLTELRKLVVKQDVNALGQLLTDIRSESMPFRENESRRQGLRQKLAGVMGCDVERVTLSRIQGIVSRDKSELIRSRKTTLQSLADLLKKEYTSTQMLLTDCERFNRMLLKAVFQAGQPSSVTYSSSGSTERQSSTLFMNLQF